MDEIYSNNEEFLEGTRKFLFTTYCKIDETIHKMYTEIQKLNDSMKKLEKENIELKLKNDSIKIILDVKINELALQKTMNEELKKGILVNKSKEEESTNLIISLDEKISKLREENRQLTKQLKKN